MHMHMHTPNAKGKQKDLMPDTSPSYNLITTFQQRLVPQSIHLGCFDGSGSQSDSQPPPRQATHTSPRCLLPSRSFPRSHTYLGVILCASVAHNTLLMDN